MGVPRDGPGHSRRTCPARASRQICNQIADKNRQIAAYIVEPDLEEMLREGVRTTEAGIFLSLSSRQASALLGQIEQIRDVVDPDAPPPVIVTAVDLRGMSRPIFAATISG